MTMETRSSGEMTSELERELLKIRPHVNSGLAHQKTPANLLIALEATFAEQGTQQSPVAYFAALVTTLEQAIQKESPKPSIEDGAIIPAVLYLLALVLPTVPSTVLRSNLSTFLPVIAPLLPIVHDQAPSLRSVIGIYASLIPSLDVVRLSTPQLRQSFASILELTMDPRPKVRKRAQETVTEILGHPPPPTTKHPYLEQSTDYIMAILTAVEKGTARGKTDDSGAEVGIWCCSLIKSISGVWPESHLSALVTIVLRLPRLSSPYLTSQSFNVLSALLATPTFNPASTHLPVILSTLISSAPSYSAPMIAQPWLEAVENTMVAFARSDSQACSQQLPETWKLVWNWLKVEDLKTRSASEKCLVALARYCITPNDILEGVEATRSGDQKRYDKSIIGTIINLLATSMQSLAYAQSIASLLRVFTSLISRLRYRPLTGDVADGVRPPTAAEVLLPELIKLVGQLRVSRHFEHRERADEVLGMSIEVIGPKAFLDLLPLNLLPSELKGPKDEGRAFLLPLLAARITNTTLAHFVDYFVPLSEQLFELHSSAEAGDKMTEAKVWEACVDQVWACLKGYCEAPTDLTTAFSTPFAQLLTRLLYSHPSLRPPILRAFQALLRSTTSLSSSAAPSAEMSQSFGIDNSQAQKHILFIKGIAGNMLSVLFNVFGSVPSESRGMVGEVISSWLSIAEPKEIEATYEKVTSLLKRGSSTNQAPSSTPVAHTMLDLLILLVPNLTKPTAIALFSLILDDGSRLLTSSDSTAQKKSYRILSRLLDEKKVELGEEDVEGFVKRIEETTASVMPGSKRDRLHLLASVVNLLPQTSLHHVSLLLPEAVLATKEIGEKARNEAFELLVCMGKKMQAGGVVRRAELDGMDEDENQVQANIEEFLTMLAGGLAGASPHMISATITSISRIVFEFKDLVSEKMQSDIISTMITFVQSNNREIVKSALGFVKVITVSLPTSATKPHLGDLVPALLAWSHDHKNHFKSKVRHILERMIRKHGWDDIWNSASEDENAKFLTNLKKRKDRISRKKVERQDANDESDQDQDAPKNRSGNAFHDVLYGSESEESDLDQNSKLPTASVPRPVKGKPKREGARLHRDDEEPLDLLHGMSSHITTTPAQKRRQPGQEAKNFKTDDETGRMIIDDESPEHATKHTATESRQGDDISARAYYEQMTSVDGFTRTATGAVKFHKDTKKRRAIEGAHDDEDVEMAEGTDATTGHKAKKRELIKLGHEFKAKKAGGDLKRAGQQEPYAYLPLSKAGLGKTRGRKVDVLITGKR